MKIFLILALLAVVATMANATVQLDPRCQDQPFPQPQQPFPQHQQPFPQPQQPFPQPQQPFPQPLTKQQLNQCQEFLVQKCKPVTIRSILWSWILQQSSCQVIQQQCCQQLAQIPKQLRYPAIFSIVHAIIVQQQQQQPFQPQPQQVGQGFIQPQQIAQFQAQLTYALQTLPAMCNVQVPLYYSTVPFSRISGF
ncbi:avenin-E-like [Lolium rigidum]|uniref:avenin-E-like n=1 Tax=Lolium rigidum TaxID=89674 RepID=UPI001F5D34BB|nr:avenin-E-like [Lolium rigidum]